MTVSADLFANSVVHPVACVTVLLAVGFGCREQSTIGYSARTVNAQQALEAAFAQTETITFRSWNGELQGADQDMIVELHRDGRSQVTIAGIALTHHDGTFTAAEILRVVVEGFDQSTTWIEAYYVVPDKEDLLLYPIDTEKFARSPGFYPFRQVR